MKFLYAVIILALANTEMPGNSEVPPDSLKALQEAIKHPDRQEEVEYPETHRFDVPYKNKKRRDDKNPEEKVLEDKE